MSALAGLHTIGIGAIEHGQEARPTLAVRGLLRQVPGSEHGTQTQPFGAAKQQARSDARTLKHIMGPKLPGSRMGSFGRSRRGGAQRAAKVGEIARPSVHDAQRIPVRAVSRQQRQFSRPPEGVAGHQVSAILGQRAEAADEIVELLVNGTGGLAQVIAQGGLRHVGRSFETSWRADNLGPPGGAVTSFFRRHWLESRCVGPV